MWKRRLRNLTERLLFVAPCPESLLTRGGVRGSGQGFQRTGLVSRSPADGAEDDQTKPWIVQRPGVMSENAAKDSATLILVPGLASAAAAHAPHDRPWLALPFSGRQHVDSICVTDHRPVRLIDEMKLTRHAGKNRMIDGRNDFQVDGSMDVFGFRGIGSQSGAFAPGGNDRIANRCGMEQDDSFAP